MPAFYLPVIVMLLALVFRGVAFEFRWVVGDQQALVEFRLRRRARRSPGFCQGVILGGLIQGIAVEERRIRRRRVRLGDAVRAAVRARRGRRLCAARRDLAGDEDRRPGRRARPRARQACCCSRCSASWRRSACGRRSQCRASPSAGSRCRTFFYLWPVPRGHRAHRVRCLALARSGARHSAVPRVDRAVPARLSRPGDLVVSRIWCRRR